MQDHYWGLELPSRYLLDRDSGRIKMPVQLTFHRGRYHGDWVADDAESGSGTLTILFKNVREIALHNIKASAAETVFINYVSPDTYQIAQDIVDDLTRNGIPYKESLKPVITDDRFTESDINAVRGHIKTLLQGEGFDTSEFDKE